MDPGDGREQRRSIFNLPDVAKIQVGPRSDLSSCKWGYVQYRSLERKRLVTLLITHNFAPDYQRC
jgi:hypothetical protein